MSKKLVRVGDSSERRHSRGGNKKSRETWDAKTFPSTLEPLSCRLTHYDG